MKAKKATQQKMYRENSWGEGKRIAWDIRRDDISFSNV